VDEEDIQEIASGVTVAWLDVEHGGFHPGIAFDDADDFVEIAVFGNDEGGEEFLGTGDGATLVGIDFEEDLAGGGVEEDGGAGANRGWGGEYGIEGKSGWWGWLGGG